MIMICASVGLSYNLNDAQRVSPLWLVSTYLVLTFAELLLSPMGISFVSKVAPKKYQGLMMGCWFGATAIGNFLVQIPAYLWKAVPLTMVWGVLVALCLASFIFIFSVMKKLEKVC
jgi:POT family proton-dependent oligopeptide transporter